MLQKCQKCGNKPPKTRYYKVKYEGTFSLSVDTNGHEEIDYGGYNTAEEFISAMLIEREPRKFLGCELCFE